MQVYVVVSTYGDEMSSPKRFRLSARTVLFLLLHLACATALITGVSTTDLIVCGVVYSLQMFGVTAGYHRYFSHRTYKMGRIPQFLMAGLAMSSAQKSVLWWSAHHRHHHRHSDDPTDLHSPHQDGFWYSHVGWVLDERTDDTNLSKVKDLARFPELMWLHRNELVPPAVLGFLVWAFFGWSGLIVGFLWATVLCWHCTFTINSLSHVWGTRRYETRDQSRNNPFLALLTFGEGWHNNHHRYPGSTRQGFAWWQFDPTYVGLRLLSLVGIVKGIRGVPDGVMEEGGYSRPSWSAVGDAAE